MAMYRVSVIVNSGESEVLLKLLSKLNDIDHDRLDSYVEVSVGELADDEDFPHCRDRQASAG